MSVLYELSDLLYLMRRLRDRDGGCPWDIEQNFESIAPHTLEEAYEVVDCISAAISITSAKSLAICCFRWSITARWPARKTVLPLATW